MKLGNRIERGNKDIISVITTAYIILFVFLLLPKFQVEAIIEKPIDKKENTEDNNYYISGVPLINQFPELPTGCEITSAAMLLNFYGINISKQKLAEEILKSPLPSFEKGRVKGASPYEYFIGNPKDNKAFGVFNKPIFDLISNYKTAENMTGYKFEEIINRVKSGYPVMVWITRELKNIEYTTGWYIEDEMFWWPKGEHTVIIIGVIDDMIIINDPYDGKEKKFNLKEFENIWIKMGSQAIVILD